MMPFWFPSAAIAAGESITIVCEAASVTSIADTFNNITLPPEVKSNSPEPPIQRNVLTRSDTVEHQPARGDRFAAALIDR